MSTPSLVFMPDLQVEAGFVTSSPVGVSGLLVLDDPVNGLLDNGTLGDNITWTDLTDYVKSFTISRPSSRQQGPLWNYEAGTCSVVFDNADGDLDPDNLSGPFAAGGVTQLNPMVPIRIRASIGSTAYSLFLGYADSWTPAVIDTSTDYTEITLNATDAFKVLTGVTIPAASATGAGDFSGARIQRLLTLANWYTSGEWQTLDTGDIQVQSTTFGSDALSLMRAAADAEIGQLYVAGSGAVTFRSRSSLLTDARSSTVQAVFGDSPDTVHTDGTELFCAGIARAKDDTTIANDVQATRTGGTLQEVKDTVSIAKYLFPRSYSNSNLILQTDTDALTWARWVLYVSANDEDRFESITVDPHADDDNLWPQVLGREIGDRIQGWVRPPQVGTPITKDVFITGISHTCDLTQSTWSTTWTLQSADKYGSFLTLDDSGTGRLDFNALT